MMMIDQQHHAPNSQSRTVKRARQIKSRSSRQISAAEIFTAFPVCNLYNPMTCRQRLKI